MLEILIWLAILPSGILIARVLRLDKIEEEIIKSESRGSFFCLS